MKRILAIDYGLKRTGLAVTDPLCLFATGLAAINTERLMDYLTDYCKKEPVEKIIIGEPVHRDGTATYLEEHIGRFIKEFSPLFPDIQIIRQDESYTSKKASAILVQSGFSKKKRQNKGLLDKVSAVVILEEYMGIY